MATIERELLFGRMITPKALDEDGLNELRQVNQELRLIQYEMAHGCKHEFTDQEQTA